MKPCSKCGKENDRKGQRYCRLCHTKYVRGNRKPWRDFTPLEKLKHSCRSYTRTLIRRGHLLVTNNCSLCLSSQHMEKHHPDYSNPRLFVELCRRCHKVLNWIEKRA